MSAPTNPDGEPPVPEKDQRSRPLSDGAQEKADQAAAEDRAMDAAIKKSIAKFGA